MTDLSLVVRGLVIILMSSDRRNLFHLGGRGLDPFYLEDGHRFSHLFTINFTPCLTRGIIRGIITPLRCKHSLGVINQCSLGQQLGDSS